MSDLLFIYSLMNNDEKQSHQEENDLRSFDCHFFMDPN